MTNLVAIALSFVIGVLLSCALFLLRNKKSFKPPVKVGIEEWMMMSPDEREKSDRAYKRKVHKRRESLITKIRKEYKQLSKVRESNQFH